MQAPYGQPQPQPQAQAPQLPALNGSLFVDDSQNRIDYSGSCTITAQDVAALADYLFSNRAEADQYGLKLYISGWKKQSRNGKPYISLQIQPPRNAFLGLPQQQRQAPAPQAQAPQAPPAGAPPQPYWNPQTGQWVTPQPAPAPAPAPAAQPPQPVWNPQTQQWVTPGAPPAQAPAPAAPAYGQGGSPGQPYAPPAAPQPTPAQVGAALHAGAPVPTGQPPVWQSQAPAPTGVLGEDEIPF
ncbi:hypothetical protein S2L_25 [Cyanophage S-2L]|nr:hypothetical protein S2L_25 [Cyanophage S-2L]